MVVKKNTEKEKKTIQIKATTGAWWKSTTTSDVSPDNLVVSEPKKDVEIVAVEVETVAKEAETVAKPKVVPKKRIRKKPIKTVNTEKTVVELGEESQEEQKKTVPSRKPSGRRPKGQTEKIGNEKKLSKTVPAEQVEAVPGIEATESHVEERPAEEKTPSKRSRGRRGRGKKPVVVAETEEGTETVAGHVGNRRNRNQTGNSFR